MLSKSWDSEQKTRTKKNDCKKFALDPVGRTLEVRCKKGVRIENSQYNYTNTHARAGFRAHRIGFFVAERRAFPANEAWDFGI